jgi:phosphatidylinositol alpha-1,6-mannosyltransferase
LLVTNDFPPRPGGIQQFLIGMCGELDPDRVVVYAPKWKGAEEFDAAQPFEVVRHPGSLMIPEPSVRKRARELLKAHDCDSVWFGAAAPLGLLGPSLRNAGAERIVATTHGHETGWAMIPGARQLLGRVGAGTDCVTYLGEYTRRRLAPALGKAAAARMAPLAPGVDVDIFRAGAGGAEIRARHGIPADAPVVVCVSRLVPRKGQDVLVEAMPAIRERVPDARLLIVGGGPHRSAIEAAVARLDLGDVVTLTGSVPWTELPMHYDAGNVFAMPARTRHRGLDVEGLGIVYLEASATGLPVVAGDSGGAPDAVVEGETGYVVDGRSREAVADKVATLLADPELATRMGAAGRAWVEQHWQWSHLATRLKALLDPEVPLPLEGGPGL